MAASRKIETESAPFVVDMRSLERIRAAAACMRSDHAEVELWFRGYAVRHLHRLAFDLQLVNRYAAPLSHIVDIGAIPPVLMYAMAESGFRVTGIDLDPSRFASFLAERGLTVLQCDIEKNVIPVISNSADVVVMNEVFEHLRIDLIHSMSEVKRILKPHGVLLMSTPNLRSVQGIYNLVAKNRGFALCGDIFEEYGKLATHGHMGHVREYTSRDVAKFLHHMGFQVERVIYRGVNYSALTRLTIRMLPGLRPFMSIVATVPPRLY